MQKLFDVIFGQKEFDKTKIEVRFDLVNSFINDLKIDSIDDFEQLEACIYKIKDQLRVKSSNLNKVIRDPNKPLTKKNVEEVVKRLLEIRDNFLNEAFQVLGKNPRIIPEAKQIEEIIEVPEEQVKKLKKQEFNPLIFQNDEYSIMLSTSSFPYLIIEFNDQPNLIFLKYLSSLLFDVQESHGSNIIIEGKKAMIISRKVNDNILESLPQESNSNIDEIFSIINKSKESTDVEFKEVELESKIESEETKLKEEAKEFKELTSENKIRPQTNAQKEDSLDSLLGGIEEKIQDPTPKPKPQEDESKIEIEKGETIEIEKKEENILEKQGIEIEKKEENNIQVVEEKVVESNQAPQTSNLTIYSDDQIHVFLNKNSKSFGEIIVEHNSKKTFSKLTESELSYINIFTKIFSSIVFDTLEAHGTNIIYNSEATQLHIIPRLQNDTLNLTWNPQKHSEEFLDQIKNKLLQKMNEALPSEDKTVQKEEEKPQELKEKAQTILEELRKIP